MKTQKWLLPCILGMLGTLWIGFGVAHGAVATAVDSNGAPIPNGPTVTIYDSSGVNPVSDNQFPEPGVTYKIVKTGDSSATFTLGNTPLYPAGTSTHPGQCTNYGSPTNLNPDFTLASDGTHLTSNDCGGTVVITDGTNTYVIPQDTDNDGLPDWWEQQYCGSANVTCLVNDADIDIGPGGNKQIGDGISNYDEYRGFIVSDADFSRGISLTGTQLPDSPKHIRTSPKQKDLFVHLVNAQCLDSTNNPSTLLSANAYPTDGTSLFVNLLPLISETQIHLIGYTSGGQNLNTPEWVDRFSSLSWNNGYQWNTQTSTAPPDDRQINPNAIYRPYIQKGLRIIECLEPNYKSPLAVAPYGSPNDAIGNAVLYTNRIVNYIDGMIATADQIKIPPSSPNPPEIKTLTYSSHPKGWTKPCAYILEINTAPCPTTGTRVDRNYIVSKTIQFILAMEVGHWVHLTATSSTSYGVHYAPKHGDNLDQAITNKVTKLYGNTFYIPSVYNTTDQAKFLIHN